MSKGWRNCLFIDIVNVFENRYIPILKLAAKAPVQKKILFFWTALTIKPQTERTISAAGPLRLFAKSWAYPSASLPAAFSCMGYLLIRTRCSAWSPASGLWRILSWPHWPRCWKYPMRSCCPLRRCKNPKGFPASRGAILPERKKRRLAMAVVHKEILQNLWRMPGKRKKNNCYAKGLSDCIAVFFCLSI